MKDRPILMNADMVRAILGGRKTQTRRPVKQAVRPADCRQAYAIYKDGSKTGWIAWFGAGGMTAEKTAKLYPGDEGFKCPYGQPGGRLWVKETHCFCSARPGADRWSLGPAEARVLYAADGIPEFSGPNGFWTPKKRPSIHMPRWASRITLEITGVRVERVQDITEDDAIAEGCDASQSEASACVGWYEKPRRAFWRTWDACYAQKGMAWSANPWVWVVEFKRAAI